VAQDCVQTLQTLIDEQHQSYQTIFNEGMQYIEEMNELNSKVRSLGTNYFDTSKQAEKFVINY